MRKYGLIGKNIDYSFSRNYFNEKFKRENIDAIYVNYDCDTTAAVSDLLLSESEVSGFNVTIPYKEAVLPYLNSLSPEARAIQAVNTIKHEADGSFSGHNTDYIGFRDSIKNHLKPHHKNALVLGTGGASKAVVYALEHMGIKAKLVSRKPKNSTVLSYDALEAHVIAQATVIVNTTPLGTYPQVQQAPPIPYDLLSAKHLLYDLVYNPAETQFLKYGKERGAGIANGGSMLQLQAEAAWKIWNS